MTAHLGVVLSGRGYGPLGPVLHYPRLVLQQAGGDVRTVVNPELDQHGNEDDEWRQFFGNVGAQVSGFIRATEPRRVTFIAKSLGTIALANIEVDLPSSVDVVEAIWLTPLFGRDDVRSGAIARGWRSLIVAGAADPYHDQDGHAAVSEAIAAQSLVLPGADHSLEVEGDIRATLEGHRRLVDHVIDFVGT